MSQDEEKRPIVIEAQKEFTPEQIAKAKREKKMDFVREMEIYNMRALRGDFDRY